MGGLIPDLCSVRNLQDLLVGWYGGVREGEIRDDFWVCGCITWIIWDGALTGVKYVRERWGHVVSVSRYGMCWCVNGLSES